MNLQPERKIISTGITPSRYIIQEVAGYTIEEMKNSAIGIMYQIAEAEPEKIVMKTSDGELIDVWTMKILVKQHK